MPIGRHAPGPCQEALGRGDSIPDAGVFREAQQCCELFVACGKVEVLFFQQGVDVLCELFGREVRPRFSQAVNFPADFFEQVGEDAP